MITVRVPLRIPFFCGGSDLKSFYQREHGAALSVTINKYNYVTVHPTQNQLRFMYEEVENHADAANIKNVIVKEMLAWFDIASHITISSISDINLPGTGLGSSSSFAVGLYKALWELYTPESILDPYYLAEDTCKIEINHCKFPIGKQDSYAAAYGGFNLFEFHSDDEVDRLKIQAPFDFSDNFILVHTGITRHSTNILTEQNKNNISSDIKFNQAKKNRDLAYKATEFLHDGKYDAFGKLLHESWMNKKELNPLTSDSKIDEMYKRIMNAGALGGKVLGAGGGGFMIYYVPKAMRCHVEDAIKDLGLNITPFIFTSRGAEVVYNDNFN